MTWDPIAEVEALLGAVGYRITQGAGDLDLVFRDDSLVGFVEFKEDVDSVLSNWRNHENDFLRQERQLLMRLGARAWNAYSVFLIRSSCNAVQAAALRAAEENLQNTRKLFRVGVTNPEAVRRSLYPLLPVQALATGQTQNPTLLLRERLATEIPAPVIDAFIAGRRPEDLITLLADDSKT